MQQVFNPLFERSTMHTESAASLDFLTSSPTVSGPVRRLGQLRRGATGQILAVRGPDDATGGDLERGLLEMGFVEGATVEVLHCGWLGRDPLAVRINRAITVALRRAEADAVLVDPLPEPETAASSHPALS